MLYGPYATPSTNLETWTFKDFREHGERISTFPKVLKCPRNHNFETKRFKELKGDWMLQHSWIFSMSFCGLSMR